MSKKLKVILTIAMQKALAELEPAFEKATGHGIEMAFGPPSKAVEMVLAGDSADVVITTPEGIDELIAAGKVAAGTGGVFGRMQMGVGGRAGAPKPDIGTVENFKRALLDAKSLIHADPATGSPSAAHFIKIANQIGIADQIKAKTITRSGLVATAVAEGAAELAIQQLAEILQVPGVVAVGAFPMELQNIVPLSAAIHAETAMPTEAAALIDLLSTPHARSVLESAGLLAGA